MESGQEGLAPQDKGGPRFGNPPLVLMGRAVCAEMVGPWLFGLWERSRIPFEASLGASGPSRAAAEAAWEGLGPPGRLVEVAQTTLEASWAALEGSRTALEASWDGS